MSADKLQICMAKKQLQLCVFCMVEVSMTRQPVDIWKCLAVMACWSAARVLTIINLQVSLSQRMPWLEKNMAKAKVKTTAKAVKPSKVTKKKARTKKKVEPTKNTSESRPKKVSDSGKVFDVARPGSSM